jgi:acyl-coenzyme A synthetase/AMP-(fatty) acid ligase
MAAAQAGAINCRTTTWFVGELSRAAYGKVMRPELQKQFRQG